MCSDCCAGAPRESGNWRVEIAGRLRNPCRDRVRRERAYYAGLSGRRVKPQIERFAPRRAGTRTRWQRTAGRLVGRLTRHPLLSISPQPPTVLPGRPSRVLSYQAPTPLAPPSQRTLSEAGLFSNAKSAHTASVAAAVSVSAVRDTMSPRTACNRHGTSDWPNGGRRCWD
jgi:hypothetical protein